MPHSLIHLMRQNYVISTPKKVRRHLAGQLVEYTTQSLGYEFKLHTQYLKQSKNFV